MGNYDDILHLSRPASRRAPMSRQDRAAQFSPFAALTGYEAVIAETGRLTDQITELDECRKAELNAKLCAIADNLDAHPWVSLTYFREDDLKDGGAYLCVSGRVKKLDVFLGQILLEDGAVVDISSLRDIEIV